MINVTMMLFAYLHSKRGKVKLFNISCGVVWLAIGLQDRPEKGNGQNALILIRRARAEPRPTTARVAISAFDHTHEKMTIDKRRPMI